MNQYRAHQVLLQEFKLCVQKAIPEIRIFDRHVGLFYTKTGTPIKINQDGMADLYLWYPTIIGPVNIEAEIKSGNAVQNTAQKNWERFYKTLNGLYVIVRNPQIATLDILDYIDNIKAHLK